MYDMDHYAFLNAYLQPDEYVLWQGKPGKGNVFQAADVYLTFFALIWLAFCAVWEFTAIQGGAPILFILCGVLFILIGLYLLFGRVIKRLVLRKRTFYVVTNRRIIVKAGNNMQMYEKDDLPPMQIKLQKNGSGTIFFHEQMYTYRGRVRSTFCILENLPDVAQAQNAINQMMQGEE